MTTTEGERARLVRLCAGITRDRDAAEDLAQDTLVAAWRQRDTLREPDRRDAWLSGIARNLCRHWLRRHRPSAPGQHLFCSHPERSEGSFSFPQADPFDLEIEIERVELARLLDRALALLPAETRAVLVDRFVHERPQAEIARRLGTTEGAVEARVRRGKLLLRRVLANDFGDEAAAFGLIRPEQLGWQPTRIWCPVCAQTRVEARFNGPTRQLQLRCPACCTRPDQTVLNSGDGRIFEGVRTYRAALSRLMRWASQNFVSDADRTIPCLNCGGRIPWQLRADGGEWMPWMRDRLFVRGRCPGCGDTTNSMLTGNAMVTPAAWTLWRDEGRVRPLPEYRVEHGGPAIVTGLAAVGSGARVEVVLSLDTLAPIHVARR